VRSGCRVAAAFAHRLRDPGGRRKPCSRIRLARALHYPAPMYRLITCPETAHLEMIEVEDTPVGCVIVACSRFRPACAVGCPRTCAARMDRREQPTQVLVCGEDTEVTVR
jgi:hypothetical protein